MEEIWKSHEDFENYEFSNHGRFRKADTKIILKNTTDDKTRKTVKGGYVITFLKHAKLGVRKRVRIHRMVALLFVHNPNSSEYNIVNHIDGNKQNNHYSNLEWTTVYENNKHAIKNNLLIVVEKLTDEDVREIRQKYLSGESTIKELAIKYLVKPTTIKNVVNYVTWKNLNGEEKDNYISAIKLKQGV
jgi:hypothetical protein